MNSEVKEALVSAEINVDEALRRMLGNEGLLLKFLGKFCEDESYNKLVAAMESGDRKEAFIAAHTLKGLAGNLGLTGLMNAVVPVVEALRGDGPDTFDPELLAGDMAKVSEKYAMAFNAIRENV